MSQPCGPTDDVLDFLSVLPVSRANSCPTFVPAVARREKFYSADLSVLNLFKQDVY